ncbi:MAG: extracellular solute-binding protein, partial [bacterium]
DLMPYVKILGIDLDIYFPNVLAIAQRDSSLYAFPKDFTPLVISFNKKLFDREGISYPSSQWTWKDFLATAQRLSKDTDGDGRLDQYGAMVPNAFYYWIPFVWMNGGDVLSPDGQSASGFFNSMATEEALQFIIDLQRKYKVSPSTGSYGQSERSGLINSLFLSNRIGMRIDGHWSLTRYLPFIRNGDLEIGVTSLPFPKKGKKINVMYEAGWCVPKNTPYPELAVELAAFLSGEKACRIRSELRLAIPAVKSVAAEQVAKDSLGIEKIFFDEVQYCRQPWGTLVERFTELEMIFQDAVDDVLINGNPIHESFTRYAKRVDEKLNQIWSLKSYKMQTLKGNTDILKFLFGVCAVALVFGFYGLFISRTKKDSSGVRLYRNQTIKGFTFLLPSFVHLLIFLITPIAFAVYLSVHRWEIIVPNKPFVGAANFIEMFGDPLFWNALKNTLLFSLNVPIGMVFALGVAVMLNQKIKGINLLRTLYFLPSVSSFVAIALVWRFLYEPNFGLANYILDLFGLPQAQWLNVPATAMLSIVIMTIWLSIGYQVVIFLTGLQGIPEMLYEAAIIDGASPWQRFKKITLPLLQPTTFFILVTSLIGSFQVFTSIYVMTGGGPARSTDVVVFHIYQAAWDNLRMGYASAMSMVLFVIIMIVTWLQFRLIGKNVEFSY